MKKKEWIIIVAIVIAALAGLLFMKLKPAGGIEPDSDYGTHMPAEKAEGNWIAVVHQYRVILWFDSGIDAEYTVEGDVGLMHIEVKDGRWHVREVDCYDYTCKNMGWASMDSLLPIICLPNDLVIVDGETAVNMIAETADGN